MLSATHQPLPWHCQGGICTTPLLRMTALIFHDRNYFKLTHTSSGSEGEGPWSFHPCLGMIFSPQAFSMTLGLSALVAWWSHHQAGLGTRSWW